MLQRISVPKTITTAQEEDPKKSGVPDLEDSISVAEEEGDKPKGKQRSRIRTLVHTNMHQEQIQVIHKVGSTTE